VLAGLSSAVIDSSAQREVGSITQENTAVLLSLFSPVYPLLARQAHITGTVTLSLGVRQDGSVESAVAISGHPMLKQAALDSAQQSIFDCRKCIEPITSYQLVYAFQLGPAKGCSEATSTSKISQQKLLYPQLIQSQNQVTVIDEPLVICEPAVRISQLRVRSAKCLYLWKCGRRDE
jgi:TonB family protein